MSKRAQLENSQIDGSFSKTISSKTFRFVQGSKYNSFSIVECDENLMLHSKLTHFISCRRMIEIEIELYSPKW